MPVYTTYLLKYFFLLPENTYDIFRLEKTILEPYIALENRTLLNTIGSLSLDHIGVHVKFIVILC